RIIAMPAIVGLLVLAFWPAAESLGVLWLDTHRTTYAHGFLVLATSAWLLWRARDQWATTGAEASRPAPFLALRAGAVLAWRFAYRAGVQIGIELLLLVIVWLSIGALLGARAARHSLVPVGFLGFALSLWDALNPLLHWGTVRVVRLILQLFGV